MLIFAKLCIDGFGNGEFMKGDGMNFVIPMSGPELVDDGGEDCQGLGQRDVLRRGTEVEGKFQVIGRAKEL
jgi:hypothetical protein